VPVALRIQAMAKMIAATMASMPLRFPYRAAIIEPVRAGSRAFFSRI
jgi:hypothetical protein